MNTLKKWLLASLSLLIIVTPSFALAAKKTAKKISYAGYKYTPIDISKAHELSGTVLAIENDTFPVMMDILLDAGTVKKNTQRAAQKAHVYNVRVRVTADTTVQGKNDSLASFELVNPSDRVHLDGAVGDDKVFEVTDIDDLSLGSARKVKTTVDSVDTEDNSIQVKIGKQVWGLDLSGASILKKSGVKGADLTDFSPGDEVYVSFMVKGTDAEGTIKQLLFLTGPQN